MVRAYGASPVCLVDLVSLVHLGLIWSIWFNPKTRPTNQTRMTGCGLCEAGIRNDRVKKRLVAIFFSLDSFQQLFFRLTLDAEFCKGHGFQSPLADLYATLRADAVGAFGQPRQEIGRAHV